MRQKAKIIIEIEIDKFKNFKQLAKNQGYLNWKDFLFDFGRYQLPKGILLDMADKFNALKFKIKETDFVIK